MAEIVLFHHALGLTPGVVSFADRFRRSGHTVHSPDLFEGRTFATVHEGISYASETGFGEIIDRGGRAAGELNNSLVYAGMSLGVLPAQMLAQTREGAVAALLLHSAIPMEEFGGSWPVGVPLQIHAMEGDEYYLEDAVAAAELVDVAGAELFLYPGNGHLFTDESLDDFDAAFTELVVDRMMTLLSNID